MAKRGKRRPRKAPYSGLQALLQGQILGSLLILLGLFTLLTLLSPRQGVISSWWLEQWRLLIGGGVLVLPFLLIGLGVWAVMRAIGGLEDLPWYRPVGAVLLALVVVTGLHLGGSFGNPEGAAWAGRGGGLIGWFLSDILVGAFGRLLSWLILVVVGLLALFMLAAPMLLAALGLFVVWYSQLRDDLELRRAGRSQPQLEMVPQGPPLPSGEIPWWRRLLLRLSGQQPLPSPIEPDERPVLVIGGVAAQNSRSADAASATPPRRPRGVGEGMRPTAQSGTLAHRGPVSTSAVAAARPSPAGPSLVPRIIGSSRSWRLPNIEDILDDAAEVEISREEIRERARVIERTLNDFGVPVRVVEANQGPAVTQYGLQPGYRRRRRSRDEMRREAEEILRQRGYGTPRRPITEELIKKVMEEEVDRYERVKIKVSKIQALANDLALALSAAPIRIEAPVPGRPIVGIEVPNMHKALVSLRSILESDTFRQLDSPLKIALGQDTAGQPAVADLTRMPHLLIAGATGSGKSVCINAIITTLLLTHTPDTLRLLMVDPKMVELTNYNGIPHLLAPVVVELERVVPMLRWATSEMDRRYKLFSKAGARHLEAYNAQQVRKGEPVLPYIIVVIDELADLMMAAPDDVERYVCRLAQMSRATGIHLIIATQRPSVDVVTGLIKANFPARIAFAVTSQVDSRVILDTPGAETLLGRGDMLFMRPDSSKLERLQGAFVSDAELDRLVRYWKGVHVMEPGSEAAAAPPGLPDSPVRPEDVVQPPLWEELIEQQRQAEMQDDLYDAAVEVVRQAGRGSVSLLQRRLRIGYSRAARLIDMLEERGVLGPDLGGSRGRQVLLDADTPPPQGKQGGKGQTSSPSQDHQPPKSNPPRVWY